MAAKKVLTRAESQALTRQSLLDAAEQMFYASGYQATSIQAIAAEAGRTIGAVYSNFESKEALCREVLRNRFMSEATKLMGVLMATDDSADARLNALSEWWSGLAADTSVMVLGAEFVTSTFHDGDQVSANRDVIERVKDSARVLFEDALPDAISKTDPRIDDALDAVVSTGTGLGIAQALGVLDGARGAELMVGTVRLWFEKLATPVDDVVASV